MRRITRALGSAFALVIAAGPFAQAIQVREQHYVMGTVLEITVESPSVEEGQAAIRRAAVEARRLDHELSSFDPASDLLELNRHAGEGFRRVSPDLFDVLWRSAALTRETGGTFDVTVAPLLALWKGASAAGRWPGASEIAAVRSCVGGHLLAFRAPDEVALELPGTALDLGGVGKGYAADRMAEVLRAAGVSAALVNFGESSLVAIGTPAGGVGWPVFVRRGTGLDGPLLLRDRALSTSRSLVRGGRVGERRIGDIIDPRSGLPVLAARQVTVIAADATTAEAWSKAAVIEPDAALDALARRPTFGVLVIDGSQRRFGGSPDVLGSLARR